VTTLTQISNTRSTTVNGNGAIACREGADSHPDPEEW